MCLNIAAVLLNIVIIEGVSCVAEEFHRNLLTFLYLAHHVSSYVYTHSPKGFQRELRVPTAKPTHQTTTQSVLFRNNWKYPPAYLYAYKYCCRSILYIRMCIYSIHVVVALWKPYAVSDSGGSVLVPLRWVYMLNGCVCVTGPVSITLH